MICARCGGETPRLTIAQRHCPACTREVDALVKADARRRQSRFTPAKDLTGAVMGR